jgi:hypothetical protein
MSKVPTAEIHKAKLEAKKKIKYLKKNGTSSFADLIQLKEAETALDLADDMLIPKQAVQRGFGGEIVPPVDRDLPGMSLTVKKDDATSLEASIERIDLADRCGVYNLAFDAADAANTQNPLEQMIIHQMAAVHKHSMDMLAKSAKKIDPVEVARLANCAARLMDTYQKAMLTLNKIRKGGKQTVTIQHVNISDSAQAIVNGNMNTGGIDGK